MKRTLAFIVSPDEWEELRQYLGVTEEELSKKAVGDEDKSKNLRKEQNTMKRMECLLTIIEEKSQLGSYNINNLRDDAVSSIKGGILVPILKGPIEGYELHSKFSTLKLKHNDLKEEMLASQKAWEDERNQLITKLKTAKIEAEDQKKTLDDLQGELVHVKKQSKEQENTLREGLNNAEETFKELQGEKAALTDVLVQKGRESTEKIETLAQKLEQTRQSLELAKEEFTNELETLTAELNETNQKLVTKIKELETVNKDMKRVLEEKPLVDSEETRDEGVSILAVVSNKKLLKAEEIITQLGGAVEIPNSGITLKIPSGALPEDTDKCAVRMRILPSNMFQDPDTSFSSNTSMVVELLPNEIRLRCPVQLTLPHCLVLKEMENHKASVFISHHAEGETPRWEEHQDIQYSVEELSCKIWLKSFCWVTMKINDRSVLAKKIVLFTSARKLKPMDKHAEIQVGYHLNLQKEATFLLLNKLIDVLQKKTFCFVKEGKKPLRVLLNRIISSGWILSESQNNPMEISFGSIAASLEHSCPFILQKTMSNTDAPLCMFKASQEGGQDPIELAAYLEHVSYTDSNSPSQSEMEPVSFAHQSNATSTGSIKQEETKEKKMDRLFWDLSGQIGLEWREIGRILGFNSEKLTQVKEDIGTFRETTYTMLCRWKQSKGSAATSQILMEALEKAGRKDLAEQVEEYA